MASNPNNTVNGSYEPRYEQSNMEKSFCGSVFWDSNLTWHTDKPEFPHCFQKVALICIPCIFLWLCLPFHLYFVRLTRKRGKKYTPINTIKLIWSISLLILAVIELFYWIITDVRDLDFVPPINFVASLIKIATLVLVVFLSVYHRKNGQKSSSVLFIFWLLYTVGAAFEFRTNILSLLHVISTDDHKQLIFKIGLVSFPLALGLFVLSIFSDELFEKNSEKKPCPDESAPLLSRLLFAWFDKMAYTGFRRPLTSDDMWDLSKKNHSAAVYNIFERHWMQIQPKNPESSFASLSLVKALWRTFCWSFVLTGLLKFVENMLEFATPFLLSLLIEYVSNSEPTWHGFLYAFLLLLSGFVVTILNGQQYWISYLTGLRIRCCIISAIYRKALKMSSAVKRASSSGEIVNLMSIDVQHLVDVMPEFHGTWTGALQICIAVYLLWRELGASVLASITVLLLMIPINMFVTSRVRKVQTGQMKLKDKRIKMMNEIIVGIKVLKLYTWEVPFQNQLIKIRDEELKLLKKNSYLFSMVWFLYNSIPVMVTLATFVTYVLVDDSHVLDAKKVFVSISLFNIMRIPLYIVPMLFTAIVQALVSLKRLSKFLHGDELNVNATTHDTNTTFAIELHNGTFAWDPNEEPILRDIRFFCPKRHLVAILGPVGCGKSSLLSALLGEMEKRSGNVNTNGKIAYVAQQAWIQNATVQDNILFGSSYIQVEYDRIVDACALNPDFDLLPGGDQTEIGERGINLSGGQKQRISLARAIYSNADIYLLDDPLSAVDSHVGKHIFDHVIGPHGLLRHKTRIFVTNSVNHLPYTDNIIVLDKGTISEMGSYSELVERQGAFAEFLVNYMTEQCPLDELNDEGVVDLDVHEETAITDSLLLDNPLVQSSIEVELPQPCHGDDMQMTSLKHVRKRANKRKKQSYQSSEVQELIQNTKLIDSEGAQTGQVKWAVYMNYMRALGNASIILTVVLFALSVSFAVYSNVWLSEWTQDALAHEYTIRDKRLGVFGTLGFLQMVFVLGGCLALASASVRASRTLHNSLLSNILHCPLSFFDTTPMGRILNRFSKDMSLVDVEIPQSIRPMLISLLQLLSILIIISISTPLFLSVVVPIILIYYLIQRFYICTSRQIKRLEAISRSPIYSFFGETISGANTIRAYNRTESFSAKSERLVDDFHKCYYLGIASNRWRGVRLQLIAVLISFCAALFAVLARNSVDSGTVGLSISYASSLAITLVLLVRSACELEANIVAVERIREYCDAPSEAAWAVDDYKPNENWPEDGVVEFVQYATHYRPGLDLVLRGLSCKIQTNEKVGVVGRTGAGKSSLALALFRIIEPTNGTILIDGLDISKMGLIDLRSKLTIIPQDPVLFSGTLRMNLDPFERYSDAEIWQALENSHLKSFVTTLHSGLLYLVSEGGENLSVGQRQLLCLARALLRKSKILILDEATAAIDLETDDLIQATIRKEFADCTVITIAHRINTIMDSTRILVLDQGVIKEFDSPHNLLKDSDTIFYNLSKDAGLV